ncbi:MAG: hypothetical protein Q8Q36_02220, partial [bacterium]|nr:hypothetical protein [bacterium]
MNFHTIHKIVPSLILAALIVSALLGASPREARAQLGEIGGGLVGCGLDFLGVTGIGGSLKSIAESTLGLSVPVTDKIVASNTSALNAKESCLDAIISTIGKIVIRQMTDSIVNWI